MATVIKLEKLLKEVRSCRTCEDELPLGPNPILRAKRSAKILVIGQAPGTKVHASGVPWDDASGKRLRDWMRIDEEIFYNQALLSSLRTGPGLRYWCALTGSVSLRFDFETCKPRIRRFVVVQRDTEGSLK